MSAIETTHGAIVIGAGVAGLAAAADLAGRGHATALVDDGFLGGHMANVGKIEGDVHPGDPGGDLINELLEAALEAGVDYRMGAAETLEDIGGVWRLADQDIAAPVVVLATGAKLKRLGAPGEEALTGRGVSQCAFCDGGLYRDKPVVVVGGGDAAFQEALHLAELCSRVDLLMRGAAPRARAEFQERAAAHANLHIRPGVEVAEIVGADGVEGIRIRALASGAEETLSTDAVFPFIGLEPDTALAPGDAPRDSSGALLVGDALRAGRAGLYAVGAARAGYGGQIADALADAKAVARDL